LVSLSCSAASGCSSVADRPASVYERRERRSPMIDGTIQAHTVSRHKGRSRSPVPVCLPGSAEGRSVVKPEVDPSRCTDRKTSISSAETGLSDDRKEREQARGRKIAHMRPEALREWRVRALRDSTPAAAKRRAVDRRDRASGASTIKSIDRINFCRSNLWSFWSVGARHAVPQRQHAWVRGRFGSVTAGHCSASPARLGARASRPHAAMRLEVNPLIGGERHGAGVSLACSDAT